MIESPLIQEFVAERSQELVTERARRDLLAVLETRFGRIPRKLNQVIQSIHDEDQLALLLRKAAACPDLDAFGSAVDA